MATKQQSAERFGKHLVEYRKKKGITQVQFAKLAKTSQSTLSGWESRGVFPHPKTFERLARLTKYQ